MMTDDIKSFLASTTVFRDMPREQLDEMAPLFRSERYPAGTLILRQGGQSPAVFFLCSGLLVVRVQRGVERETVAYLHPPSVFGELSFITGLSCVADVEVEVDAEVVLLPKEAVPTEPRHRDAILRGLVLEVAERLRQTVVRGAKAPESPILLLRNHPGWEAPLSFAAELARSLARQTAHETLLVQLGGPAGEEIRPLGDGAGLCALPLGAPEENLRPRIAEALTEWKGRFENVLLNPVGPRAAVIAEAIHEFANFHGDLLGRGDPVPAESEAEHFVVQSAAASTLPLLNGRRQLIFDAAESETAHKSGRSVSARFRRTVDSIARCLAGTQVGLALGGGAAWGWAHIGVLSVLEGAGLPIDAIAGCSMGSVIGAFRCAGFSLAELKELADYWCGRTRRFIEWRLWCMCLLNEKVVRKTFHRYFRDRHVNQTEIPYWANAVDIQTGKEYAIQTGSLVDCIRASISLPGLLPPVARKQHLLVDAGIMDPVPARLLRRMGCHFTIAVNAMAELEASKVRKRYPFNAFDIMTRCMFVMGHEIGQAGAEQTADVVFTPSLGDISMLQFARSQEIIECGRRAAEAHLPEILAGYENLKARLRGEPQPQPAPRI